LRQVIVADALKVIKICDLVKLSEQETYQKKTVLKLQLRLFTDFFAQVNTVSYDTHILMKNVKKKFWAFMSFSMSHCGLRFECKESSLSVLYSVKMVD